MCKTLTSSRFNFLLNRDPGQASGSLYEQWAVNIKGYYRIFYAVHSAGSLFDYFQVVFNTFPPTPCTEKHFSHKFPHRMLLLRLKLELLMLIEHLLIADASLQSAQICVFYGATKQSKVTKAHEKEMAFTDQRLLWWWWERENCQPTKFLLANVFCIMLNLSLSLWISLGEMLSFNCCSHEALHRQFCNNSLAIPCE